MAAFVADRDFTLYVGDVRETLAGLPDESVDCVVTSPPYWGLRDYQVAGQLGLEPSPDEYVASMVAVFRQVRRVLADHGTCWVNLGDTYNSRLDGSHGGWNGSSPEPQRTANDGANVAISAPGLKPKDLVGIPWRVAFALQADGWYLRADIIWAKPNPMPESVTDRPTKSHEYVFLLSKRPRYWFDQEPVREPHSPDGRSVTVKGVPPVRMSHENHHNAVGERWPNGGRNVRSVWEIATQPYPEAHFATYPEELVRRCLFAGCPEQVCRSCGKPRERITSTEYDNPGNRTTNGPQSEQARDDRYLGTIASRGVRLEKRVTTEVWSDCGHDDYRPGVVLDPFMGSGTTALVARKHGRRAVGIELNPQYAALADRRLSQLSLLAEATA